MSATAEAECEDDDDFADPLDAALALLPVDAVETEFTLDEPAEVLRLLLQLEDAVEAGDGALAPFISKVARVIEADRGRWAVVFGASPVSKDRLEASSSSPPSSESTE